MIDIEIVDANGGLADQRLSFSRLAKIDLTESSRNRDRIIDEWSRRYSAKAEAKP